MSCSPERCCRPSVVGTPPSPSRWLELCEEPIPRPAAAAPPASAVLVVVDRQHADPVPRRPIPHLLRTFERQLRDSCRRRCAPLRSQAPASPPGTSGMRRRAPPALGRRRPSRMCYPYREQEENPSSWPSLTKCKERALVLDASQHTLKVDPPRSLATSTLAAYSDLVEAGLSLTPRNGRRVYISWFTGTHRHPTSVLPGTHRRLSPKAVSKGNPQKPARTPKRPLFTLNLHQKSSAKTTNFKA